MVSMGDVRRWSPEGLEEAYRGLRKQEETLVEAGDGFGVDAKVADWTGRAADAAESARTALLDRMEIIVAGVAGARRGIADAADAVTALLTALAEADELGRRYYFRISDDGLVIDTAFVTVGATAQSLRRAGSGQGRARRSCARGAAARQTTSTATSLMCCARQRTVRSALTAPQRWRQRRRQGRAMVR